MRYALLLPLLLAACVNEPPPPAPEKAPGPARPEVRYYMIGDT